MSKNQNTVLGELFIAVLVLLSMTSAAYGQGTAFTYQGRLTDGGNPANGNFDMQFKLFDTATVGTGTQQGLTITSPIVQVTDAVFNVQLDFGGGVFDGSARFLEIGIRPAGSANPYTVLAPRQPMTSTPYTIRSISAAAADTATSANQLGGLTAKRVRAEHNFAASLDEFQHQRRWVRRRHANGECCQYSYAVQHRGQSSAECGRDEQPIYRSGRRREQ